MQPKTLTLEPDRAKYVRFLGGQPETGGMRSGAVTLQPGDEVGEHSTHGNEETLVLLEGSAELTINGQARRVEAPALAYVPPQSPHNVRNVGDQALRYVFVVSPAGEQG